METVRILVLAGMRPGLQRRLRRPNRKPGACGRCVVTSIWLPPANTSPAGRIRDDLQQATKGQFALHGQDPSRWVCHHFLANVDTARELRITNRKTRYPSKDKRFLYPAVSGLRRP